MNTPVTYRPVGGVVHQIAELALPETAVSRRTYNFIFEEGCARTRPRAQENGQFTSITDQIDFARAFQLGAYFGNPVTVLIDAAGAVYRFIPGTGTAALTGTASTFGNRIFHNAEVVNGVVLIGNNTTGGIIRFDPTGTSYTLLGANARYRYVTSHITRAVAAYGDNTTNLPRTVAWSAAGDETNWTTAGSGSSVLADAPDDITGIGNLNDVIIIMRQWGVHLGYPTGVSSPAFRFQTMTRRGVGCPFPASFTTYDNFAYFIGHDNVYRMTLQGAEPIGDPVREELYFLIGRKNVIYKGFICRGYGPQSDAPRSQYHLVPITDHYPAPHFMFDIREGKWSRHVYRFRPRFGFEYAQNNTEVTVELYDHGDPATIYDWEDLRSLDYPAALHGRILTIGDPSQNYSADKVLLVHKSISHGPDYEMTAISATEPVEDIVGGVYVYPQGGQETAYCTLTVQARMNHKTVAEKARVDLADIADNEPTWQRTWANTRVKGNFFEYILECPMHSQVYVDSITGMFQPAGEHRGDATA